jgi:hypothetical protein
MKKFRKFLKKEFFLKLILFVAAAVLIATSFVPFLYF